MGIRREWRWGVTVSESRRSGEWVDKKEDSNTERNIRRMMRWRTGNLLYYISSTHSECHICMLVCRHLILWLWHLLWILSGSNFSPVFPWEGLNVVFHDIQSSTTYKDTGMSGYVITHPPSSRHSRVIEKKGGTKRVDQSEVPSKSEIIVLTWQCLPLGSRLFWFGKEKKKKNYDDHWDVQDRISVLWRIVPVSLTKLGSKWEKRHISTSNLYIVCVELVVTWSRTT
jgi:hypothetical protein